MTTIKNFLDCFTDDRSITVLAVGSCFCFTAWISGVFKSLGLCMPDVENPLNTADDAENAETNPAAPGNCGGSRLTLHIATLPEIFFDVTSPSANWVAGSKANRAHAIGSVIHGFGAAGKDGGFPYDESCSEIDPAAAFIWWAEIIELGAIVSTLEGWRKAVSATSLAVGGILIASYDDVLAPSFYRRVGYGMQIIYVLIVVIAATEDWNRLWWLLPEVPFETISLGCSE